VHLIKHKRHPGLITCFSLILAGAIGNIIDSAFYGMIFSESNFQLAKLFPPEGGYASFLQGRVVDMLYFPIIEGHFPAWFPLWANEQFIFFRPVFNVADSAITIGVLSLIIWQKKFFSPETETAHGNEETPLGV
jgi:signal peptidase II